MKPYKKQKIIDEIKRLQTMSNRYNLSDEERVYIDKMIRSLTNKLDDKFKYRFTSNI